MLLVDVPNNKAAVPSMHERLLCSRGLGVVPVPGTPSLGLPGSQKG